MLRGWVSATDGLRLGQKQLVQVRETGRVIGMQPVLEVHSGDAFDLWPVADLAASGRRNSLETGAVVRCIACLRACCLMWCGVLLEDGYRVVLALGVEG